VRLLLDTHVLLWWFNQPEVLTEHAIEAIADETNVVYVSAATVWEAGIKQALGKLRGADDLVGRIRAQGLDELPIELAHAAVAAALPTHHTDPFDRLLVGQAQTEGLTLVTRDLRMAAYGVPLLVA
jgi:PIN domain nuclease of toxin-antitoxin system